MGENTELVYRSTVSVEAGSGRAKAVTMPVDGGPVVMGVNAEVAAHYKIPAGGYTPHATTMDYIVGAATACLTGTFGGALEAIGQPITDGQLTSEGHGDIVLDGKVMVIRSISVHYQVKLRDGISEDAVTKAHETHASRCPVARSIGSSIPIHTELTIE